MLFSPLDNMYTRKSIKQGFFFHMEFSVFCLFYNWKPAKQRSTEKVVFSLGFTHEEKSNKMGLFEFSCAKIK